MHFNDPKVRAGILAHLNFATGAVAAIKQESARDPEIEPLIQAMQMNLALTILNYTLQLDYRLKNSLIGQAEGLCSESF